MRVNPDRTTQNYLGLQILLKYKTETLDPSEIHRDRSIAEFPVGILFMEVDKNRLMDFFIQKCKEIFLFPFLIRIPLDLSLFLISNRYSSPSISYYKRFTDFFSSHNLKLMKMMNICQI